MLVYVDSDNIHQHRHGGVCCHCFYLVQWKSNEFGTFRGPKMDTFRDPKINPKSFDLGTSKRYLKITFVYLEMDTKWGKNNNKKKIVYSSVL